MQSALDLGLLLHQGRPGRRFLASVLWTFADESGLHEPNPVFTFAGYVAPAESWGVFAERWAAALRPHHPQVTRFHMTHCISGFEQFSGWSKEKSLALVEELVEIINSTKDVRGYCVNVFRGEPEKREGLASFVQDEPFVSGFGALVHGICHRATEIDGRERIAFVFDQQKKWRGQALEHFVEMKDAPDLHASNRLGTAAFESSEQFLPLQAADLLAQQARRHFVTEGTEDSTEETLKKLCEGGRVRIETVETTKQTLTQRFHNP